MSSERRNHPRLILDGLLTSKVANQSLNKENVIIGDIIDISYSGIRVKLKKPLTAKINDHIVISLTLPECGTPLTIHGNLKHQDSATEFGLHYIDNHPDTSVDDLLFECIKLTDETLLIKTT